MLNCWVLRALMTYPSAQESKDEEQEKNFQHIVTIINRNGNIL